MLLYNMKGYNMDDKTKPIKPIEQTEIGTLLGVQPFSTIKYESKAVKKEWQRNNDGTVKTDAEIKAINAKHLIKGKFDFNGVTVSEIVTFLCSTTSVLKQYQNNELNGLKETDIPNLVNDGNLIVSVRNMLDTTKTRVTAEASVDKTVDKMKKDGKSTDDIRKQLESQLALLTK